MKGFLVGTIVTLLVISNTAIAADMPSVESKVARTSQFRSADQDTIGDIIGIQGIGYGRSVVGKGRALTARYDLLGGSVEQSSSLRELSLKVGVSDIKNPTVGVGVTLRW